MKMSAEGETAAITPELYNAIVTIVDDRTKDIRVTREDFNELRAIVTDLASAQRELAHAQAKTEEQVGRLEDAVERLAQAQAKTEERVGRLEDAVERLAQAQAKTEERVGRLEDAVERLAQAQAKTEEALKELAMQVGKLSDNIGFSLEDVAKVVLPGYLERHLHIYVDGLDRRFFFVDGKEVEINLYGVGKKDGKEITILGEVKSRIYEREVNKFIRDVATVLPVIKGEVLKIMFGYLVHPYAAKRGDAEDIILVASYQR
jgi:predicted nuclease with TOPRIM domain